MKYLLTAVACVGLLMAPVPAQAKATPADPALAEAFRLVNVARSKPQVCGTRSRAAVKPLRYMKSISVASQRHAQDMATNDYFAHESLDGRTFVDRIKATSYKGRPAGENIAAGQQSAREVVSAWMNSPPHCTNIMRKSFKHIGLGLAARNDPRYGEPVTYWVTDFGYGN